MRRGGRGKSSGGRGGDARRGGGGRGGGGFDRTSAPPPQPLSETYKATVKSVALEAAPFGVFVELTNPGARHHGKGGLLQDPSAAMGVLWIARFIAFWEEVCARAAHKPPLLCSHFFSPPDPCACTFCVCAGLCRFA